MPNPTEISLLNYNFEGKVQKPYGHVYAVNKLRISNMEFVYGA